MGRIGRKLYFTYFLLLIIFFTVASLSFNFFSKKYIIRQARNDLLEEGRAISSILSNVQLKGDLLRDRIKVDRGLRIAGRFIDAQIIVLNDKGHIVYRDINGLDRAKIANLLKSREKFSDGYLMVKVPILSSGSNVKKGNIVLLTRLEEIFALNKINRQARRISFIIAGVIALVIGMLFERSITNPIKKLSSKMKKFSVSNKNEIFKDVIKTGDEIEYLDKSFNEMAKRIIKYDKQLKKFFQNTSHELKTPLMSIQGYAEAIRDGIVEVDEMNESLDIIIKESQRLKQVVDELILLTKLEDVTENYKFERNSLGAIVNEAIASVRPLAEKKGLNIVFEDNLKYKGLFDREKMVRALINILGNAVRYSEKIIEIKVHNKDNNVEIRIADDGIGFKEVEKERVFDRFYKGKGGSTGLGLPITKAIIEGHGGNIRAENNKPKGALFLIDLPGNNINQ